MIPSSKWFPTNLQDRAAWYDNFNAHAQATGLNFGLVQAELDQIKDDNNVIQFLANATTTLDAYSDGIRTYRRLITEGDIGDQTPDFPANLSLTLPVVIPTGMFERVDDYAKRIRASAAYTEETGAVYGIIPQASEGFDPSTAKPAIEATPSPGNVVDVKFVRGGSDGIFLQHSIDKGEWTNVGNYFKSPVAVTIPPNVDNLPRLVQLRARFLDANTPVGDYSNIVTVQTIP